MCNEASRGLIFRIWPLPIHKFAVFSYQYHDVDDDDDNDDDDNDNDNDDDCVKSLSNVGKNILCDKTQ